MIEKIGVVGGGMIGGVLVQEIGRRRLARAVGLVDIMPPDLAKGKCLDIAEGSPVVGFDCRFEGSKTYEAIAGSEIVINTAGVPRKPKPDGTLPSREELLATNLKITDQVAEGIKAFAPKAIVISIANPLDAIVYRLHQLLKLPKGRLMGMAGVLDSARYRYFIAEAAGVSVDNVTALVLGGHGDDMVPIRSATRVAGLPVEMFVEPAKLDAIEARTRGAGGEVVKLLGSGSAFVSPAWSALAMAEAIIYDRKQILAVSALLEGEYGVKGLFVGVPAVLGKNGVEKVIQVPLNDAEKAALERSVGGVGKTCAEVDQIAGKA
ncbi:MAG: malate dehydrogenase [Acidobacteria bacterium]|jgi:malate dehydrogenase|nr:malate dehydrogenase [Acidobacteriota bacterium]